MVATRRMVQQDPDEDLATPTEMLRKKPVRRGKAPATTAQEPVEKTAAKTARTTRTKKADEVAEDDVQPVKAAPAKTAAVAKKDTAPAEKGSVRGTRGGTVRGKKADTVEEAPKATTATKAGTVRGRKAAVAVQEDVEPPAPAPAKTTKAGSVRGKKPVVAVDEAPSLPAPQPKATRGTRATAAKAAPLSPKKITQVSKPAARTTRNAKPAPTAAPAKASVRGRAGTKRRQVSDENADLPELHADLEEENNEVVVLASTPVKSKATPAPVNKTVEKAASEASMSSRPTTPNDSTLLSLDKDEQDAELAEIESEDEDEDELARNKTTAEQDMSFDELCGPKTPMKRASPGAEARYLSSVQRTIRKYEESKARDDLLTPARRFAVLGTQRGTPQTQKPYCKPVPPPSSTARPMTVQRAAGRAFVFRDLAEGLQLRGETLVAEEDDIEAEESQEEQGGAEEGDDEEASFIVDEDIIPVDTHEEDTEMTEDAQPETPAPLQLHSPPASVSEADVEEEIPEVGMSYSMDDEEDYIMPADIEQDPEETMLADDEDMDDDEDPQEDVPSTESFETEDTVIITRPGHVAEDQTMIDSAVDDDDAASDAGSVIINRSATPTATVIRGWQSRKSEATITVNFDDLFSGARSSVNEPSTLDEVVDLERAEEDDAVAGANMEVDAAPVVQPQPRRETMDFSAFIDMTALSEPTEKLDMDADLANIETTVVENQAASGDDEPQACEGVNTDIEMAHTPAPIDTVSVEPGHQPAAVLEEVQPAEQQEQPATPGRTPHYALPTFASARRKSLPANAHRTPVQTGARPHTSDGASMPRIADPFADTWWSRSRAASTVATPIKTRPSTAHGISSLSIAASTPVKTPVQTPGERFPRLAPRKDYEEHARTVVAPRFKAMEEHGKRRETFHRAGVGRVIEKQAETISDPEPAEVVREIETPATPVDAETPPVTPGERYPRLRPRTQYEDHAKTVAAPSRFRTPIKTPLRRPATAQKPVSLRKAALHTASTPVVTSTKTPLKAAAMTPGQVPLTPHPGAPLRGVVALVEVFTLEGASASSPFLAVLQRLGAKTTRTWNERVTHVVFKDGSATTLQKVRLHNKGIGEGSGAQQIHCVNSRWVTDCDVAGTRMEESDEAYVVDVAEVPRGGKRRRKSMEPSALLNIGGNIVRDRKSSGSLLRTPSVGSVKMASPARIGEKAGEMIGKENSGDEDSEPATPAWIADPGMLVQQTMPLQRVRKLDLPGKDGAKSRRLTGWGERS